MVFKRPMRNCKHFERNSPIRQRRAQAIAPNKVFYYSFTADKGAGSSSTAGRCRWPMPPKNYDLRSLFAHILYGPLALFGC